MTNGPKAESKTWAMAKEALRCINMLPEKNADLALRHTHSVTDVFSIERAETTKKIQGKFRDKISVQLLANIAVLKLYFGFENRDLVHAMLGAHAEIIKAIRRKAPDIAQRAAAYSVAKDNFPALQAVLTSGRKFEDMDLFADVLAPPTSPEVWKGEGREVHVVEDGKPALSLYMVQRTEEIVESEAYEAREPDALCLAAEHFATLGDDERAWELINEVIADAPDHPGAWYQKARLLLKQAAEGRRAAARMRMLSEEGEALSATESHFEEMAGDELVSAQNLRRQAFDASLKAFSLLPGWVIYEKAAIKWSHDYGTLKQLRCKILEFIIREAGERCNPYWESGDLYERIEARLGRTREMVFPPRPGYTGPGFEWVGAPEKMARLSALPLFSEDTDKMLPLAYEEFKKSGVNENFLGLQLSALNFLRVLAPSDVYRREVKEFADSLSWGYPHTVGWYFGIFPGHQDPGDRRKVLHEHLGSIMSPAAQRDFVGRIYTRWQVDVEKRRQEAVVSIYDEEIRSLFAAGDILAAYQVACRGEAEGVYRRDEGWGALTLRRLAQYGAAASGGIDNSPEIISQHLADKAMRDLAEDWYEDYYENQLADEAGGGGVVSLDAHLNLPPCS